MIAALYVTLLQQPPQICAQFVATSLMQKLLIAFSQQPQGTFLLHSKPRLHKKLNFQLREIVFNHSKSKSICKSVEKCNNAQLLTAT